MIARASDLLEAASREGSPGYAALSWWATVLAVRVKLLPGEETNRLLAEAERRFDTAKRSDADPDAILQGRQFLVWAQAVQDTFGAPEGELFRRQGTDATKVQ